MSHRHLGRSEWAAEAVLGARRNTIEAFLLLKTLDLVYVPESRGIIRGREKGLRITGWEKGGRVGNMYGSSTF